MKLSVVVKPRSRKSEVISYKKEILTVKVSAVPHKGKANEELIKVLSIFFNIPKSAIIILSGQKSKIKTLHINSETEDIIADLKKLL